MSESILIVGADQGLGVFGLSWEVELRTSVEKF